jgi:FADH2 O2-dependent halogenase
MVSAAMLYFIAAIYCEERERDGMAPADAAFLLADHAEYRRISADFCRRAPTVARADAAAFADELQRALTAFNSCNLGDPRRGNLYEYAGTVCD